MKETKDDANGKAFCAHVFEDLTLLKLLYYSKCSTDLMQSLFKKKKTQWYFFTEVEKYNSKTHMEV